MIYDKQDCIESLARILENVEAFRRKTALKYPEDQQRNLNAAEALKQLARDCEHLTDEQWSEFTPHFGWSSQSWRETVVQVAKLVGFAHKTRTFNSFVRLVLLHLPSSRIAA
jgi:hypothetical protein